MRLRRVTSTVVLTCAVGMTAGLIGPHQTAGAAPPSGPVLALAMNNVLVGFDAATPGAFTTAAAITGLQPGEMIVGFDIRPATGELIGIGVVGGAGRIYRINQSTGAATQIGTVPFSTTLPAGGTWAVDFNPTVDRIRFVHSDGLNLRLNPVNGTLAATDAPITGGDATGASYDRSIATAAATTLYAIDGTTSELKTVGSLNSAPVSPNAGTLSTVGPLGVTINPAYVGFDITPAGTAVAALNVGGSSNLYGVDLVTGAATLTGAIGNGSLEIIDVATLPAVPVGASQFTAVAPSRLLDTRDPGFVFGKPAAGSTLNLQITGMAGIPATATAVVLNTTGTEATADGFVTVYPTGDTLPQVSNHNLVTGQTRANLTTVKIGANGKVSVFTQSGTHMVVDVFGYYAPATSSAGRFTPLTPARLVDTRKSAKIAANSAINIQATGVQGVPTTGVSSVLVNVTATEADGLDVVTAYASGSTKPTTSNLNISRIGGTDSNLAVVPVGTDGKISVHSLRGTHLAVDVVGWYSDATTRGGYTGLFVPVSPSRILDTRSGLGGTAGPLPVNGSLDLTVAGVGGIPATGASAALINVTDVDATRPGFVTVFPTGTPLVEVSSINVDLAGTNVPNLVSATLGTGGRVTLFSYTGGHLLADVAGWFTA